MYGVSDAPLEARVRTYVRRHGLLTPGQRVLVAVSGGPDSTALALLLAQPAMRLRVALAHVDHGWRGAEGTRAERDAVRTLAQVLSVPLHLTAVTPLARTEDAARRARYQALLGVAAQQGVGTLATGHHAGDQAETMLARLLRGSGAWGLAGIAPLRHAAHGRVRVVRPLLDEDPHDLRTLVRAWGLRPVQDPTNADPRFERTRLRVRLRRARPRTRRSLRALAARLRLRVERRQRAVHERLNRWMRVFPFAGAACVPREVAQGPAGVWMEDLLRTMGASIHADARGPWLTRRHVALARRLVSEGGSMDLPNGMHWHVRGRNAWLWHRTFSPGVPRLCIAHGTVRHLPALLDSRDCKEAIVDADKERAGKGPVRIRSVRRDDTFAPFGRHQPRRVGVLDWLKRRGVPSTVRTRQVVCTDGDAQVLWVVGHRIDAHAALSTSSRRFFRLRVL